MSTRESDITTMKDPKGRQTTQRESTDSQRIHTTYLQLDSSAQAYGHQLQEWKMRVLITLSTQHAKPSISSRSAPVVQGRLAHQRPRPPPSQSQRLIHTRSGVSSPKARVHAVSSPSTSWLIPSESSRLPPRLLDHQRRAGKDSEELRPCPMTASRAGKSEFHGMFPYIQWRLRVGIQMACAPVCGSRLSPALL